MAFSNRVQTTTQSKLVPKLVDAVLNGNVVVTRFLAKAKPWDGKTMDFPIKLSKNSTGGSFSGFDTLSTSATDNRQKMSFNPKQYQITSALPQDELTVNDTDQGILNLMSITMESDAQDAADDIGTMFYSDGTGNGGKDFSGLAEMVDDGTTTSTYGGLTRATYSPNLSSTVTASGGTLTLAKMRTLYNAVSDGNVIPTLAATTKAVYGFYEQLLQPQQRIMTDVAMVKGDNRHAGTGFKTLDYMGMPVIADAKCTSGVLFFLNEDYIDWYAKQLAMTEPAKYKSQDIEGNDYSDVPGLGFSWGGWIKPANAAAVVGHTYLFGQFINRDPKRSGKLTGITGV